MKSNKELKIYLVDDDPFCLRMYAQQLNNLGYDNISVFGNGPDCLNSLTGEPDVIFLDHGMQALTGLEVLKKIKRFNPDIYVVFVSGQDAIDTAVSSLKFGAFDYIVKGESDAENMCRVLNKIAQVKSLLQENKSGIFKKIISLF